MDEISAFDRAVAALGEEPFDIEGRTAPLNGWLDRSDIEAMVRTVLTSIREPSEVMVDHGFADMGVARCDVSAIYTAMIDAMLEEG